MKSGDNTIIARYKDDETSNPASPSYDFWKIAGVQPREARMIDHLNFHLIVVESSGGVVQNPSYGLCAITEAVGGNTLACTWSRIAHGSSFEETTS